MVYQVLFGKVQEGKILPREASVALALSLRNHQLQLSSSSEELVWREFAKTKRHGCAGDDRIRLSDIPLQGVLNGIRSVKVDKLFQAFLSGAIDSEIWNPEISPEEGLLIIDNYSKNKV
jgi:hypothetical protein